MSTPDVLQEQVKALKSELQCLANAASAVHGDLPDKGTMQAQWLWTELEQTKSLLASDLMQK